MKKLVVYENGDRIVQAPPAWISYHRTKITDEYDLTDATDDDIDKLKKNPNHSILKKFPHKLIDKGV